MFLAPTWVSAITPGVGKDVRGLGDCVIWREGMPPAPYEGMSPYCDSLQDSVGRLHELEVLTGRLEEITKELQRKNAPQGAISTPVIQQLIEQANAPQDARIEALDGRVGALEKAFKFLSDNLAKALNTVIGLLTKLVK